MRTTFEPPTSSVTELNELDMSSTLLVMSPPSIPSCPSVPRVCPDPLCPALSCFALHDHFFLTRHVYSQVKRHLITAQYRHTTGVLYTTCCPSWRACVAEDGRGCDVTVVLARTSEHAH